MISRRQVVLAIGAGALTVRHSSFAQQQSKVWRIGFLAARSRSTTSNPDVYYDAFVQEMRALGYVEGQNLEIEWRFADGKYDRLPNLAAELVQKKVEVIVAGTTPPALAAQRATTTIPIVAVAVGDPVESGLVASLGRPGGNITGVANIVGDIGPKRLELLRLIKPTLSRVAVLGNPANSTINTSSMKKIQDAARRVGVTAIPIYARTSEEIERGFAQMLRERAEGVIVAVDTFLYGQRTQIAGLAVKYRMLLVSAFREEALAGSLLSYGPNNADIYRRAATYVDKILKGAKAGDLPIEQPSLFELVINLRTAKAVGLTISRELLQRADRVIE